MSLCQPQEKARKSRIKSNVKRHSQAYCSRNLERAQPEPARYSSCPYHPQDIGMLLDGVDLTDPTVNTEWIKWMKHDLLNDKKRKKKSRLK